VSLSSYFSFLQAQEEAKNKKLQEELERQEADLLGKIGDLERQLEEKVGPEPPVVRAKGCQTDEDPLANEVNVKAGEKAGSRERREVCICNYGNTLWNFFFFNCGLFKEVQTKAFFRFLLW